MVVLIVASVGVSETSKTCVVVVCLEDVVCLEGVSEVSLALVVVVRLEGFCVTSLTTSVVVRIEGVDGTVLVVVVGTVVVVVGDTFLSFVVSLAVRAVVVLLVVGRFVTNLFAWQYSHL